MKLYGKKLPEYIAFVKGPLILLTVLFAVRWLISEWPMGHSLHRYLSLTLLSTLIVVYLPLKVHTRKFGGYPQLGILYLLIGIWINLLVALAIAVAALSGRENIYSRADVGHVASHTTHIVAHLTVFISLYTLINFAIGALILYLLRRCDVAS